MSGKKIMAALLAAVMLLTSGCALAAKGPTLKGLRAEIEGKSDEEIRTWAAEEFEGAVHADPAEIPYPDNRDAEGYLPAGEEFVHEDPEKGLWGEGSECGWSDLDRTTYRACTFLWRFDRDAQTGNYQVYNVTNGGRFGSLKGADHLQLNPALTPEESEIQVSYVSRDENDPSIIYVALSRADNTDAYGFFHQNGNIVSPCFHRNSTIFYDMRFRIHGNIAFFFQPYPA